MRKFKSFVSAVVFCVVPGVFGMHGGDCCISDSDLIVRKAKCILRNIKTINQNMEDVKLNPVVLLGATGSGKTSLLHVLAGTKMEVIESQNAIDRLSGKSYSLVPDRKAASEIGEVAGGGRSVTSDIHPFRIGNVIYCDGPGFFDTNGEFTEVGNNLIMNEVLRRGAKVLWVVSVSELSARRGEAAVESLDYLQSLLLGDRTKAGSIGVVISKGTPTGKIEDAFAVLEEKKNHHWLIDYLSDHREENAFWFPIPESKESYKAPQDLIRGITNFAGRRSELITGSMGLQAKVVTNLVENHRYFDVKSEIGEIVTRIARKSREYKGDLSKLRELEKIFNKLWYSLAARSLDQEMSDSSQYTSDSSQEMSDSSPNPRYLVKKWRDHSNAWREYNFPLRDFVDVIDDIEYFKDLCSVGDEGFAPKFEKGLVWEELVDCISRLSSTSKEEINRLKEVGDNWKHELPNLMGRNKTVSKKIKKGRQIKTEKLIAGTASATAGVVGALAGGVFGKGPASAVVGGASGAVVGATVGKGIMKGIGFMLNLERDFSNKKQS